MGLAFDQLQGYLMGVRARLLVSQETGLGRRGIVKDFFVVNHRGPSSHDYSEDPVHVNVLIGGVYTRIQRSK